MIHAPVNPIARYPASYTKLSTLISSLPQYQSSLSHLDFKDVLQDVDLMDPITAPIVQLVQMAFVHAIKSHDHVSLQTLLLWSPPLQLDNKRSSGALLINYHDPKTGLSAIHHALRAKPLPSLDTLTMLYQAGADINAQTYYGRTALHHLARIGVDKDGKSWGIQKSPTKVAQHQQEHSRLRANSSSSSTPTMPTLEEDTSQLRLSTTQGSTAQESDNRLSTISAISSRSALSDTTTLRTTTADLLEDPFSKSILAAPTIQAHLGLCASLLIHFGALVNIADPTGNTPLHFAAEFGAVNEVLEVLIMNGNADLHLKNKRQQTPLDVCKTEDVRKYMLGKY
jgi:ankyrin repeat protein